MKKTVIFAALSIFLAPSFLFAATNNLNATVATHIQVKAPTIEIDSADNNSAIVALQLDNLSHKTVELISAMTPLTQNVQLHKTVKEGNNQSQMEPVNKIELHANQDLNLTANRFHIMLLNLKQPLKIGEKVPLTLVFSDGSRLTVNAKVA